MIKIQEYHGFSKDYLDKEFGKIVNDVVQEVDIFQKAFGNDFEKYYYPFIFRDKAAWENDSLVPAKFYVKSILDIEDQYGKIDKIEHEKYGGRLFCYINGKLIAVIYPKEQDVRITDKQ